MLNRSLPVSQVSGDCMWNLSEVLSVREIESCNTHVNSKRKKKDKKTRELFLKCNFSRGYHPLRRF